MKRSWLSAAGAAALIALPLQAADHTDGPAASADPAADITDLFAWTSSDGARLNLVLNVFPAASSSAKFSNTVQYVLHTTSRASYGAAAGGTLDIVCTFDVNQRISCWAGTEYLTGDASAAAGITSSSGKLKVFAGLRDDPFFFNLDGFKATAAAVRAAKSSLTFDAAGCPLLDANTANTLVTQLKTAPDGSAAKDHFAGLNVLSIVVSIDKSLLTKGGSLVSVWGGTYRTH
jgi:hypothetical protein